LSGSAALRGWFGHVFANFAIEGFALRPASMERHGGVMIEHGSWTATFQPKAGGPGLPAGGTYLTVYAQLADGSVRMIRDTFNGLPG
jgi:ketosteroid isomerase-like protein